ncbi:predicted protein [Postia placenta Mad-698-R]|nr:predicted protein [Postia placenta Mad-698-R]
MQFKYLTVVFAAWASLLGAASALPQPTFSSNLSTAMKKSQDVEPAADAFDIQDQKRVKHTRIGVWDLYEARKDPQKLGIPGAALVYQYKQIVRALPYLWTVLNDAVRIKNGILLLSLYAVVQILKALVPAAALWYSGQLLSVVQSAAETRTVDRSFLLRVFAGRTLCAVAERLLRYAENELCRPFTTRMYHHFEVHLARARARLDVPTYGDVVVKRQFQEVDPAFCGNLPWRSLDMIASAVTLVVQMFTQTAVLFRILKEQPDGLVLAAITIAHSAFHWFDDQSEPLYTAGGKPLHRDFEVATKISYTPAVWAATTKNADFIKLEGLRTLITQTCFRKELVAGNLGTYCASEFKRMVERLGSTPRGEMYTLSAMTDRRSIISFKSLLEKCWGELPQVVFALRAVQYPASIPVSLASLQLIRQTATSFGSDVAYFIETFGSMAEQLSRARQLYEVAEIPNVVPDGHEPFPENVQKARAGLAVETQ